MRKTLEATIEEDTNLNKIQCIDFERTNSDLDHFPTLKLTKNIINDTHVHNVKGKYFFLTSCVVNTHKR